MYPFKGWLLSAMIAALATSPSSASVGDWQRIETERSTLMTRHTKTRYARHTNATSALALALAATGTSAFADIVDIAWDANGRFDHTVSVAPAKSPRSAASCPPN